VAAVAVLAACSSSSDAAKKAPAGPPLSVAAVQQALLRGADVGPTWSVPDDPPAQDELVNLCGGDATPPPIPAGASVIGAPLVDEGEQGAQSLTQYGLVYGDATVAAAALAQLRAVAGACPPSVSVPARTGVDRQEPAYTETLTTSPLAQGEWSGFVVVRHKQYEAGHAATADAAVAVLQKRNVVLVDAYAIYRLGAASTGPQFTSDWQKLVGSVVHRLGG
jgi:hypothetical protein